jgi:hypothetical protein
MAIISIPDEILEFLDRQGGNRSSAIVTILLEYMERKEESDLEKAYGDYEDFCRSTRCLYRGQL